MSKNINFKKGLDISLLGEAQKIIKETVRSKYYALKPSDFHGVIPKMEKKEGDKVRAGEVLFHSKAQPDVKFVSPVSGLLLQIRRGSKRRIERVVVEADSEDTYVSHSVGALEKISKEDIKKILLSSGCWPFIKQRPYDIIADSDKFPKSIFVSAYSTAPLSANAEFIIKNEKDNFQRGIEVLAKLTGVNIHLCVDAHAPNFFRDIKGVELHEVLGAHPAGNVGSHIQRIDPINPGEYVWTVVPQGIAVIGKLFSEGVVDLTRVVAIAGSQVEGPQYKKVKSGALIGDFLGELKDDKNIRIISGNVLTGDTASKDDFLGFYHTEVTVIPEGNKHRMLGWLPFKDNHIPSFYSTSFFKLFNRSKPKAVNTNLNGEERAIVVTGKMEQVMGLDIFPMQLLKECMANNIEKMEALGIYEVAPEDFALIDFISTSKIEAQHTIREALDLMIREVG